MQERQSLFRIALTRALYDQMAPQLCQFDVPGKLSCSSLVFILIFSAFLMSGKHRSEERKTPIGPIHTDFLFNPIETSFSFPPTGTPEDHSWEQEQMARPQMDPECIICSSLFSYCWSLLDLAHMYNTSVGSNFLLNVLNMTSKHNHKWLPTRVQKR